MYVPARMQKTMAICGVGRGMRGGLFGFLVGLLFLVGLCIIIGVLNEAISMPTSGELVKCSDYGEVADKYVVPSNEYHIVTTNDIDYICKNPKFYAAINIGDYISLYKSPTQYCKLKKLNKSEANGLRNACQVIQCDRTRLV